jgi:hypothetical protein
LYRIAALPSQQPRQQQCFNTGCFASLCQLIYSVHQRGMATDMPVSECYSDAVREELWASFNVPGSTKYRDKWRALLKAVTKSRIT